MMRQQTGPPQLPNYPYRCESCGAEFAVTRPETAELDPLSCPACGGNAQRAGADGASGADGAGGADEAAWYYAPHLHNDWAAGGVVAWEDMLIELRQRVPQWMEQLQGLGVRGADQFSALVGPAINLYAQYGSVVDAEGRSIQLGGNATATAPHERGYLAAVWETLGQVALERALRSREPLEPDARLAVLFLVWTQPSISEEGAAEGAAAVPDETAPPGLLVEVVRCFAEPVGIDLAAFEGRIVRTEDETVRLLPVAERAAQLLDSADSGDHAADRAATALDRVHTAMLLHARGEQERLAALLRAERDRGPASTRLATALLALTPAASEEHRLLDAVLLAIRAIEAAGTAGATER